MSIRQVKRKINYIPVLPDNNEKKSINIDYLFDSTINRQSFSIFETADIIVSMFEKKIGRQVSERQHKTQIF